MDPLLLAAEYQSKLNKLVRTINAQLGDLEQQRLPKWCVAYPRVAKVVGSLVGAAPVVFAGLTLTGMVLAVPLAQPELGLLSVLFLFPAMSTLGLLETGDKYFVPPTLELKTEWKDNMTALITQLSASGLDCRELVEIVNTVTVMDTRVYQGHMYTALHSIVEQVDKLLGTYHKELRELMQPEIERQLLAQFSAPISLPQVLPQDVQTVPVERAEQPSVFEEFGKESYEHQRLDKLK